MSLSTGKMRHTVTIEQRVPERDSFGGISEKWQVWASGVAADINAYKGKENFASDQILATQILKCRIRYRKGLTPDMRVVYRGIPYVISFLFNIGLRNETWEIHLTQGKGTG